MYESFSDENAENLQDWDKYLWIVQEYCMACVGELLVLVAYEPVETRCPLPLKQAQHYFRQLIAGLEYLHGLRIVHYDIKVSTDCYTVKVLCNFLSRTTC